MNKVHLSGTVQGEVKVIAGGKGVNFRVAADSEGRKYPDKIGVAAWAADVGPGAMNVKEGDVVEVMGRIQTRSYESANGVKKYVTEVVASSVSRAGSAKREPDPEEDWGS